MSRVTMRAVIRTAALQAGLQPRDLIGPNVKWSIARPRFRAIWAIRQLRPDLSTPQIGRAFGGRDHTTILNALTVQAERITAEPGERIATEALIAAVAEPEARMLDWLIEGVEAQLDALRARRCELSAMTGESRV